MPLSQFDVRNLNESMSQLGDTFRQRRLDQQQREDEMRRELIQKQLAEASANRQERGLTIEQKRLETEQGRATREGEGQLDVYLKGQNGGSFHFRGPKSGYDSFVAEMQKNGQPVTPTDQPLPRSAYGSYKFDTDNGTVEIAIENEAQLDAIHAKVKALGGKLPPKTAPLPAAGIQYEREADQLDQQAKKLEATDPETAKGMHESANRLREKNKVGPTGFVRTTVGPDLFTGQTATNITTQVPFGTGTPPGPVTAAPRVAKGGYIIGGTYKGGLKYLGGEPTDPNSWTKVQ